MNSVLLDDSTIIEALEIMPGSKMKIKDLQRVTRLGKRVTGILQHMQLRGLILLSNGNLSMETEVSLPR